MMSARPPQRDAVAMSLIAGLGISAIILFNADGYHSRDYYTLLRFAVFCTGGLAAWFAYTKGITIAIFISAAISLLFNPFVPIRLSRDTWQTIDIGTALLFLPCAYYVWRLSKPDASHN